MPNYLQLGPPKFLLLKLVFSFFCGPFRSIRVFLVGPYSWLILPESNKRWWRLANKDVELRTGQQRCGTEVTHMQGKLGWQTLETRLFLPVFTNVFYFYTNFISSTPLLCIFYSWSKQKRIRTVRQYSGSLAHPRGMYYNGKEGRKDYNRKYFFLEFTNL